jgi:hypothetical protein
VTTVIVMTLEVAATSGTAAITIMIARDNRNQHGDRRDNFKGKRARDDDDEVNAVKKFGGVAIMKKTMLKP